MAVFRSGPRWLTLLCRILAFVALVLALVLACAMWMTSPPSAVAPPGGQVDASPHPLLSVPANFGTGAAGDHTPSAQPQHIFQVLSATLLYQIDHQQLIYDSTHTASVDNAVVTDLTGTQISSLEELSRLLKEQTWFFTADLILDDQGRVAAICVTDRLSRPTIGLSWSSDEQDYTYYKEVLRRSGAAPVELPQITDAASAQAALAQVDGIMVTGGEDIDPALYGDPITPHGSNDINTVRDTSDYYLIQQAIAADKPMLAVCRGCQMLNVAQGGGLIQDITTYLKENRLPLPQETGVYHKNDGSQYHDIAQIDPRSKWLYDLVGGTSYANAPTFHHQAIDSNRLGQGLTPVAWTQDGMIEAVEYQDNRFALGIQFHPERDALGDTLDVDTDQDICNRFFRALVANAVAAGSESRRP